MSKAIAYMALVTALTATPLVGARASTPDSDSSCVAGMRLNFCDTDYRATRIAVAATAVAGVALLAVRADDGNANANAYCPPLATTTTPEPATIAMVATGMALLGSRRMTRRRRAERFI